MRPRRVVLLVVAAAVFAISVWAVVGYRQGHQPFDRDRWIAADLAKRTRADMVDDLVHRHRLVGRTRPEVVALLGPPTDTDKFDDWDMVYVLGPDSNYGIDHEWLVLQLDGTGRVVKYRNWTD